MSCLACAPVSVTSSTTSAHTQSGCSRHTCSASAAQPATCSCRSERARRGADLHVHLVRSQLPAPLHAQLRIVHHPAGAQRRVQALQRAPARAGGAQQEAGQRIRRGGARSEQRGRQQARHALLQLLHRGTLVHVHAHPRLRRRCIASSRQLGCRGASVTSARPALCQGGRRSRRSRRSCRYGGCGRSGRAGLSGGDGGGNRSGCGGRGSGRAVQRARVLHVARGHGQAHPQRHGVDDQLKLPRERGARCSTAPASDGRVRGACAGTRAPATGSPSSTCTPLPRCSLSVSRPARISAGASASSVSASCAGCSTRTVSPCSSSSRTRSCGMHIWGRRVGARVRAGGAGGRLARGRAGPCGLRRCADPRRWPAAARTPAPARRRRTPASGRRVAATRPRCPSRRRCPSRPHCPQRQRPGARARAAPAALPRATARTPERAAAISTATARRRHRALALHAHAPAPLRASPPPARRQCSRPSPAASPPLLRRQRPAGGPRGT